MSTQISSRRGIQLALQISSLPPLALGSPMNEKDQLPCIMITPSTPIHEHDYQLYQFQPEPPSGFFSCVRRAFSSSPAPIALPQSPTIGYEYAPSTKSSKSCWSPSKRFRVLLVVFAALFFALHILFMPKVDEGIYEVFHGHHGAPLMDDTVAVWEGMNVAPTTATPTPTAVALAEEIHSSSSL